MRLRWTLALGVGALAGCSLVTSLSELGPDGGATDSGVPETGVPGDSACVDLQKDPKNCGVCGRDCLGGTCTAGACDPAPLAAAQVAPSSIALDADHVYWVVAGTIRRTVLSVGGNVETVGKGTLGGLAYLTVDGASLFATAGAVGTSVYAIPSSEVSGVIAPSLIASFDGGAAAGFGLDSAHLFVFQPGAAVTGCTSLPCLFVSARDGSNPTKLWASTSQFDRMTIDGGRAFLLAGATLSSIGALETSPTLLATLPSTGGDVAADAKSAYVTLPALGSIAAVPRAGGPVTTIVAGQASPRLLTAGAGFIAWVTDTGLMGCSPSACTTPKAYAQGTPSSIALDARAIYWTDPKRAGVFMTPR